MAKNDDRILHWTTPLSDDEDLYIYRASVVRVVDGDTIVVDLDLGLRHFVRNEHIRLYGINACEINTETGKTSRDRLIELVEGKEIFVRTIRDKDDKYGRLLGVFWVADRSSLLSVNKTLVMEGLAAFKTYSAAFPGE